MSKNQYLIRPATAADVPGIFQLVQALAAFEQEPEAVINSPARMLAEGFDRQPPAFHCFVATQQTEIVGIAVYFFSYSTWKGRALYLDDLMVAAGHRRRGIGQALFHAVLHVAQAEQLEKVHWQVLNWNNPAIAFYQKLGASLDNGWSNCALDRAQIAALFTD